MVNNMVCYLCNKIAINEKEEPDYTYIECKKCGKYKIAGTAVAMTKSRAIDRELTLKWLENQRINGIEIPLISSRDIQFK